MNDAIVSDFASHALPLCEANHTVTAYTFSGTQALFLMNYPLKDWCVGLTRITAGIGGGKELTANQLISFGQLVRRYWMP